MPELSLNILDLAENSFLAGAAAIEISIEENTQKDSLSITVRDNGKGMDSETAAKAADPFYSGKKEKEWGLGIPFLKQTADLCSGTFSIESAPESGTVIRVTLQLSHIDRPPLGALGNTIAVLAAGRCDRDISLTLKKDGKVYEFQTEIIRRELGEIKLSNPAVLKYIETDIVKGMKELEMVQ